MADLSIIIGTLNEAGNIDLLVQELRAALHEIDWEVIFVDDASQDGTAARLDQLAADDARIQVIHRRDKCGLASACIDGLDRASSPLLAVMDADLQHDASLLPTMIDKIQADDLEIVIASRFVQGGARSGLSKARSSLSRVANSFSGLVVKSKVKDLMSGYFLMRADLYQDVRPHLEGVGFKILLDIMASANRPLKFTEIAADLRRRHDGASKLDTQVMAGLPYLMIKKILGKFKA